MTSEDPQHQPPTAAAITYRVGKVDLDAAIAGYRACSLGPRRPVDDRERMTLMYAHANLVVGAYADDLLVGVARALTDFTHSTYLADLAVRESHQRQGIGLELMHQVRDAAPSATLILLAAPDAETYYPHVGFTPQSGGLHSAAGRNLAPLNHSGFSSRPGGRPPPPGRRRDLAANRRTPAVTRRDPPPP